MGIKATFLAGVLVFLTATFAAADPGLEIGSPPPMLALPGSGNEAIDLNSYLGKKVILLSFGTTWSKSCQSQWEYLNALQKKSKNLAALGVSFDRNPERLDLYLKENKISFPVMLDKKYTSLKEYRILIIPSLFIIDQNGNLANIYIDFDEKTEKLISKEIEGLLAKVATEERKN
jgi:peroxiredoxin